MKSYQGRKKGNFWGGAPSANSGGLGASPEFFFQIWPLIRAFSDYFWGGAGFARGGRQTILGCQGGGRPRPPPLILRLWCRVTYISCSYWNSLACIQYYLVHTSCTVEDQVQNNSVMLSTYVYWNLTRFFLVKALASTRERSLGKSSRYGNSLFKLETIIIKLNEQINNEWILLSWGGGACVDFLLWHTKVYYYQCRKKMFGVIFLQILAFLFSLQCILKGTLHFRNNLGLKDSLYPPK